eukprot:CAMPEP_0168747272 /NCGR_PEP_ID=MMETSP0724-20121128/15575_1 /TAXON_ID=265536 /ORGANISM="Amphiprora sp., Strain CCMP467" /LENGTH=508 /DNA_ID=CAMNT_0008795065 /DNA_START=123 /DNA_END=1649 /DNA_ORIENTATION=-
MSTAVAPPLTTMVPSSSQQQQQTNTPDSTSTTTTTTEDFLYNRLRQEALETLQDEPELSNLLHQTVLAPGVKSFEDAVAATVCYRLLLSNNAKDPSCNIFCAHSLLQMLKQAFDCQTEEYLFEMGHSMAQAVRGDALAVLDRDPACDTLLEVILFMKGFSALVCHRAARQKWIMSLSSSKTRKKRSMTALFLQSQASAVFGVDIHPAATMGAGILLDHGTGIVIGETAHVGNGCTLLHGVTLGGTGKQTGDRHPKVGHHVLIGAGTSILGNIQIGNAAKIGAGSIVLKSIPAGATAVGAPAKIIGHALEANPASTMDEGLDQVGLLHKSMSSITLATGALSVSSSNNSVDGVSSIQEEEEGKETTDGEEKETKPKSAPESKQKAKFDKKEDDSNPSLESKALSSVCVCPFRDYSKLDEIAPRGTVTICSLFDALRKRGEPNPLSKFQVQSTFFHLDVRNVGHVSWNHFVEHLAEALQRAASESWSDDEIATVVHELKNLPEAKRPVKR